jgi:hypothetical protein
MARKPAPAAPPPLPPPSAGRCWAVFLAWVLGVPALVAGALGVIWLALLALGRMPMEARAASDMVSVLWWLGVIVLLYPAMLWVWWGDLRQGLRAAHDWASLSPEAQAAALGAAQAEASAAQQAAARPARRKRRRRDE